jgi:hypothetical protein
MFLEAGDLREITDFPTHLGLPVSSYPNLVLSIHAYTHFYTIDSLLHQPPDHATYPWGGYEQSYSLAEREARAMGAALFVAEFGNPPSQDPLLLANQLNQEERHVVGFAFWTWKENGGSWSWGMYNPPGSSPTAGCLRASREQLLARVYPRASADPHLSYRYDSRTGAFWLGATGRSGDPPTEIYIPAEVPSEVTSAGAVQTSVSQVANGGRLVTATPSGGSFSVSVEPGPLSLQGC